MKAAAALMRFLWHDDLGRRFSCAIMMVGWLAVAWTSTIVALGMPLLLAAALVTCALRTDAGYDVEELDDLF